MAASPWKNDEERERARAACRVLDVKEPMVRVFPSAKYVHREEPWFEYYSDLGTRSLEELERAAATE